MWPEPLIYLGVLKLRCSLPEKRSKGIIKPNICRGKILTKTKLHTHPHNRILIL